MTLFLPFQTCYSIWEKACAFYTIDISFMWCDILDNQLKEIRIRYVYLLGTIQAVMEEFETLMAVTTNVENKSIDKLHYLKK